MTPGGSARAGTGTGTGTGRREPRRTPKTVNTLTVNVFTVLGGRRFEQLGRNVTYLPVCPPQNDEARATDSLAASRTCLCPISLSESRKIRDRP